MDVDNTQEVSAEDKARAQGWRPQEEYNGNPDNWKTAEQFIEDGNKIAPIQKERNDRLTSEIMNMKNDFQAFKEMHFKTLHEILTIWLSTLYIVC